MDIAVSYVAQSGNDFKLDISVIQCTGKFFCLKGQEKFYNCEGVTKPRSATPCHFSDLFTYYAGAIVATIAMVPALSSSCCQSAPGVPGYCQMLPLVCSW